MPIRYSAFCRLSAAGVTPPEILAGLESADLHLVAETYEIEDDAIVKALSQLRVENAGPEGFVCYHIIYDNNVRPIELERWETPEQVQQALAETLENLEESDAELLDQIGAHLGDTVDIIDASFGFSPGQQIAPALASEVLRYLAERFDGIVRDEVGAWWKLGPHHEFQQWK